MTNFEFNTLFHLIPKPEVAHFVIYSNQLSPRLAYTCQFIFNQVLHINYSITNNIEEFKQAALFKINYSEKEIENCFKITPHPLLFEPTIQKLKTKGNKNNDLIYFYENKNGNLNYDIFSSVFYFISRYEEWQLFTPDTHQRFEAENSILFQNNLHLKPVVDLWIKEFKIALEQFYPQLKFPERKMNVISTIDVDNLYAFKSKGLTRTIGGSLKDILKLDIKNFSQRLFVILGLKKDPFDIYEDVSGFCLENKIPLIYFFLYRTGTTYDRTVNPKSTAFKKVFGILKKQKATIGLHPSYDSAYKTQLFEQEIEALNSALNDKIKLSRQHFLRFNIQSTPHLLLKNGIVTDFSMGFASTAGFRAGTSFPFYYYDFNIEKETKLLFVPFCAMDGAYTVYNKTDTEIALQSLLQLAAEVNKVNGFFITVYHERSFSDHLYPGFGTLYKKLHQTLKQL